VSYKQAVITVCTGIVPNQVLFYRNFVITVNMCHLRITSSTYNITGQQHHEFFLESLSYLCCVGCSLTKGGKTTPGRLSRYSNGSTGDFFHPCAYLLGLYFISYLFLCRIYGYSNNLPRFMVVF